MIPKAAPPRVPAGTADDSHQLAPHVSSLRLALIFRRVRSICGLFR